MGMQSIWVGEKRLCQVTVSGFQDVPGFGLLPEGRVNGGGKILRGARARLLRHGVLIAEDLRIGALMRRTALNSRLEAKERVDILGRCILAIGHRHVFDGDQIQAYVRANPAGVRADLVLGYQDPFPEQRRLLGRAEVREVAADPLAGPVARAVVAEGRLAVGARVRVVRDGRPVVEALRLLALADGDGGPLDELPRGSAGTLVLGHFDVRPGDIVQAYDVLPARQTEGRKRLLTVMSAGSNAMVAVARVQPVQFSPHGGEELAVGHRARVLRDQVVVADGLTIGFVHEPGMLREVAVDYGTKARVGWLDVGLDFPSLQHGDEIEPYEVLSADHEPEPEIKRPQSRRFMLGFTVGCGAVIALFGSLDIWAGVTAWRSFRTPPTDDTSLDWGSALGLALFFTVITAMCTWILVLGHIRQRQWRERARRRTTPPTKRSNARFDVR
ncbi:hypothetical protein [Actinomadura opuntiae]|uniref:hypothetical protein n=1 Tax=Actinomadura sp. OS1-43 TaxID=604315 RepID=UPI00255A8950|nr:hypothetical protein [Actinomadura sp. OS1-43]MDL4814091.1 hypothetical protein [Actinomadura sp. OS1-43]